MCELFGMNFNQEVSPSFSFRGFMGRGGRNPDGWGLAFYDGRAAAVFKEPAPAPESRLAAFLRDYGLRSRTFVAHVRLMSRGRPAYANTHPFLRELFGRDWVFAHNGTVSVRRGRAPEHYSPAGETDSERAFCALLSAVREWDAREWDRALFAGLHGLLSSMNGTGSLNCLFSDGEHLFCYRDAEGYKGLSYTVRRAPFERVGLKDEDWEIDLGEEKRIGTTGCVVASTPLTDEKWESFDPGELRVFRDGETVYSSSGKS